MADAFESTTLSQTALMQPLPVNTWAIADDSPRTNQQKEAVVVAATETETATETGATTGTTTETLIAANAVNVLPAVVEVLTVTATIMEETIGTGVIVEARCLLEAEVAVTLQSIVDEEAIHEVPREGAAQPEELGTTTSPLWPRSHRLRTESTHVGERQKGRRCVPGQGIWSSCVDLGHEERSAVCYPATGFLK